MDGIEWEDVGDGAFELQRIKVPYGWLIRTSNCGEGIAVCFYPDPAHEWKE